MSLYVLGALLVVAGVAYLAVQTIRRALSVVSAALCHGRLRRLSRPVKAAFSTSKPTGSAIC